MTVFHVLSLSVACRWKERIAAVQDAGRSYRKALHLNPARGSAWGDAAAAAYHESQLRRAHPTLRPETMTNLRRQAASLLRGVPPVSLNPQSYGPDDP